MLVFFLFQQNYLKDSPNPWQPITIVEEGKEVSEFHKAFNWGSSLIARLLTHKPRTVQLLRRVIAKCETLVSNNSIFPERNSLLWTFLPRLLYKETVLISGVPRASRALFTSLPRFEVAHSFAAEISRKTFVSFCKSGSMHTVCSRPFFPLKKEYGQHCFLVCPHVRNLCDSVEGMSNFQFRCFQSGAMFPVMQSRREDKMLWIQRIWLNDILVFFSTVDSIFSLLNRTCLVSCKNADEFLCAVFVTTGGNPSAFTGYRSRKESRF